MRNLGKNALFLTGSVVNFPTAGVALVRFMRSGTGHVSLHFRDGTVLSDVSADCVWPLVCYFAISSRFGTYTQSDLRTLHAAVEDTSQKLASKFSREELLKGASGARPGFKDALLFALVRKYRPLSVIETGVAQGVSSYVILQALRANGSGSLLSIDLPNRDPSGYRFSNGRHEVTYIPETQESGWIVPGDLRGSWTIRLGESTRILKQIDGRIGMFFHDSEHTYDTMTFEYEWALEHAGPGCVIASNNIGWSRAWPDFVSRHREILTPAFKDSRVGSVVTR